MATKAFALICTRDKEVALGVGLRWSFNAINKNWMDEVKVILFGPAEELAAHDSEVQAKLKDIQKAGIEVLACKACADEKNITAKLEAAGLTVVYVGSIISQLLKDGWASLTF